MTHGWKKGLNNHDYWHADQTVVGDLLGRSFLPVWSADLESGQSLGIKKIGLVCLFGDYWSSPNSNITTVYWGVKKYLEVGEGYLRATTFQHW